MQTVQSMIWPLRTQNMTFPITSLYFVKHKGYKGGAVNLIYRGGGGEEYVVSNEECDINNIEGIGLGAGAALKVLTFMKKKEEG